MSNGSVTLSPRNDNQTKVNAKNGIIRNGVKSRNSTSPLPPKASINKDKNAVANPPNLKQLKKVVTFSDADDVETKLPKRLLLVSNKCKYGALLEKAVKQNVVAILYNYENNSFDSLLALISASLGPDEKVSSVGCIMTCKHSGIFMLNCHDNSAVLSSASSITKANGVGLFFKLLFNTFVERNRTKCRLDLFGAAVVNQLEKNLQDIEDITGATISVSKEPLGVGNGATPTENGDTLGEIYFTPDKIRNWINGTYQTIDLFEKIRMVGKGAYGTAVLYRKRDDNSLVILKEINMSELNSQERQLAMNETKVLKMLNHPNIVCCYDSFEENGVLMIEMEYADDGTLAQFLAKQEYPVPESEILDMFSQIVCGICYMHEQKVLHRDLKTANIFLTKEKVVKIGDFGVSKIMSSHNKGANTVLGTPYYISPEICEGKPYNEKSDIWALGCILHEMATGQKTFEGTNLPALVNKIMRGQISPIQGNYSQDFRQLVNDMLHREPEERPTAQMLELIRIPDLMEQFGSEGSEKSFSSGSVPKTKGSRDVSSATHRETRSVLYLYDTSLMSISPIEGFPSKIKIRQVSVGVNHFIVVAMEFTVYTWGQGEHGQLGHGTPEYCAKPQAVEALKGKSVTSACAGDSFSVFVSDNGIVMTCGDGRFGCLGHGDYVSSQRPRLIESLLSTDVNSVACGLRHVVALGSEGEVFAWGDGKDGCLGIGSMDITSEPTAVSVEKGVTIRDIRCGPDGTMFITQVGTLLACGNNKHDKLGLNERRGFLTVLSNKLKLEVEYKKTPTPVKAIKAVIDVALGKDHTAVLTEQGDVYMLGSNKHAQLGTGDQKIRSAPFILKSLRNSGLITVICGDTYTAVGTTNGDILFWGTHFQQSSSSEEPPSTPANDQPSENEGKNSNNLSHTKSHNLSVNNAHRRTHSNASTVSYRSTLSLNQESSEGPSRASSFQDVSLAAGDKTAYSRATGDFDIDSDASTPTNIAVSPTDMRMPETIRSPRVILNVRGSPETSSTVSTPDSTTLNIDASKGIVDDKANSCNDSISFNLFLDCLIPCSENFYMLVETNAPVSLKSSEAATQNETLKKGQLKTQISCLNLSVPKKRNQLNSASSNEAGDEYTSSEASELDSFGTAPTWIKEELKKTLEAVVIDSPNKGVSSQQNKKSIEQTKRPTTLSTNSNNSRQRKRTPSPSRFKVDDKSKSVDCSSSNSSSQSVAKQPVNYLSVNSSTVIDKNSKSTSPHRRRSPQTNKSRLRGSRGRGRLGGWEPPKPSRSPVRGNMQELRTKLVKLQNEKRDTERRLKEAEEKNENMIRELQKKHEKDRLEQEVWLQDQIKLLKKQLDDQQREINERDSMRQKLLKQGSKSDSVKNSKICNIQ